MADPAGIPAVGDRTAARPGIPTAAVEARIATMPGCSVAADSCPAQLYRPFSGVEGVERQVMVGQHMAGERVVGGFARPRSRESARANAVATK